MVAVMAAPDAAPPPVVKLARIKTVKNLAGVSVTKEPGGTTFIVEHPHMLVEKRSEKEKKR